MSASLIYQFITIVIGFLVPQLFLKTYGPSTHGLISTISNLMNYVMLLNAGLLTASIQTLYKPLANNDFNCVSSIVRSINKYFKQSALSMTMALFLVAIGLAAIIRGEVSYSLVFFMTIIMGFQYILENLMVYTSMSLLQADNKLYVINIVNSLTQLMKAITQIFLISAKANINLVLIIPAILVVIRSLFLSLYLKKHYRYLDRKAFPNDEALSKRKYAIVHQISGLVLNNTDVIILTIFFNQLMVSKYSIYQMIFSYLYLFFIQIFSSSFVANFGHLANNKDKNKLAKSFKKYELLNHFSVCIVYSCTAVLLLPFIKLYTTGIETVSYVDSLLGILFLIYGLLNALRIPYLTLVDALGLYEETQQQAIIEMTLNLIISILGVLVFGIYGVLIGTVISFLYRTFAMLVFVNRKVLNTRCISSLKSVIITCFFVLLICFLYGNKFLINNWFEWLKLAIMSFFILGTISIFIFILLNIKKLILRRSI